MTELATRRPSREQRWPMTREAWLTLVDELGRLRADVASLAGELADGVVDLAVIKAARRLDVLSAVLDAAERIHESERAVIGRRVTVLEPEGESVSYRLVFPGDGDPAQGCISPTRRSGQPSWVACPATESRSQRRRDGGSSPCSR